MTRDPDQLALGLTLPGVVSLVPRVEWRETLPPHDTCGGCGAPLLSVDGGRILEIRAVWTDGPTVHSSVGAHRCAA